ncbi:MAG: CBS domain-containing protein [Thermoleophilia bacterium]|nr:CBS domain-containing protein [Thermoleophilia bacterium]
MTIVDIASLQLVSVRPDDAVLTAIGRMLDENVGAVAVCDGSVLAGIFTERDVLRLAGGGGPFATLPVADVMTRHVVAVSPDDDIVAVAHLMSERRIRHVPVLEGGNVLGIVGIRDVVAVLAERLWREHDPSARETIRELLGRAGTPPG